MKPKPIKEGKMVKAGRNESPTSPRPPKPHGQNRKQNPRAFIMNLREGHDIDAALEYSNSVIPLTEGVVDIFNLDLLIPTLFNKMKDLRHNPEIDYLIPSGSPLIALALSRYISYLIYETDFRYLRLLIWDTKRRTYFKREIILKKELYNGINNRKSN